MLGPMKGNRMAMKVTQKEPELMLYFVCLPSMNHTYLSTTMTITVGI